MACHQHTQKSPRLPSGLQRLCSYGPTTTQQQAHNRTPAGFTNHFQYTHTHTHTQVQNSASLHLRQSLV